MSLENGSGEVEATRTKTRKVIESVISGIKIIEVEHRVMKPVFHDVKVDRPVYVDKEINVPTGLEKLVAPIADSLANVIMEKIMALVDVAS